MSLLYLIASLGAINGLLLGFYLLFKRPVQARTVYFGGLLLALGIRIGKSAMHHYQASTDKLILQIGLSACAFIGPFFYLFLRSVKNGESEFRRTDLIALSGLLLVLLIVGSIYPYRTFPEVWNGVIIYGIYGIWAFFVGLSLYLYRDVFSSLFKRYGAWNRDEKYLLVIIGGVVWITLTYQFAFTISGFPYIWGAFSFSFLFYYLAWQAFLNPVKLIPAKLQTPNSEDQLILNSLHELMTNEQAYTQSKLKLSDLASQIDCSPHLLSKILNQAYSGGFAQFVNEYRVEASKQLLRTRKDLSIEGIGYEAGFNSKSSFYATFKKIAGCTPKQFQEEQVSDLKAS